MALVKYNNNSISAITAASSLTAGAMTLIKEQTASSSSTIDFVDGTSDVDLDATYPIYLFKFINIHPSGDGVNFQFQANASGGSGFNETITSTFFGTYHGEADNEDSLGYETGSDQAQGSSYQTIHAQNSSDSDHGGCGELWLFGLASTTYVKHFISQINNTSSGNSTRNDFCAGYINTTSAIDEISFKFNSGNIDAGTFKLYGIKDS